MNDSYKVVILDDNEIILESLKFILNSNIINFEVFCFTKPDEHFWELVDKIKIDLFIVDIKLGAENGRNIVDKLINDGKKSVFLFISGYDYSLESLSKFAGRCIFDFMSKPIDRDIFINRVVMLLNSIRPLSLSLTCEKIGPYSSLRTHYRKLLEQDRILIDNFKYNMDKEFAYLSQDLKSSI
jgi:two-component SAPR family response regulator